MLRERDTNLVPTEAVNKTMLLWDQMDRDVMEQCEIDNTREISTRNFSNTSIKQSHPFYSSTPSDSVVQYVLHNKLKSLVSTL